ncbi:S-adenosyl-L-methionine-dependent methyltransferase [Aspergillus stella-maris]|uniref:S-adenosyl-L-methionine-dependent methyltransferase n=1 Tax=Aspergillus stella-maris TaxID=1810926 RepID=UPI003CCD2229
MPRLATALVLRAYKHDRLLPLLLRDCRSLNLAINELRWLRDRALRISELRSTWRSRGLRGAAVGWRSLLRSMCLVRSRGMPLQYILGDQPFGDLDIKCARGVLIPRHETEAITIHTSELILKRVSRSGKRSSSNPLRILDLCTGTGCIPLLLHSLLSPHFSRLSIVGVDISDIAVKLANENIHRNVRLGNLSQRALEDVIFRRGNVFELSQNGSSALRDAFSFTSEKTTATGPWCDVLVSNPPYVSSREYHDGTTSRSVRMFEPMLALVPPKDVPPYTLETSHSCHQDLFYSHIAGLILDSRVKLAVLECANRLQANRVAALCRGVLGEHTRICQVTVDVWSVTGADTDPWAVIIGAGW